VQEHGQKRSLNLRGNLIGERKQAQGTVVPEQTAFEYVAPDQSMKSLAVQKLILSHGDRADEHHDGMVHDPVRPGAPEAALGPGAPEDAQRVHPPPKQAEHGRQQPGRLSAQFIGASPISLRCLDGYNIIEGP